MSGIYEHLPESPGVYLMKNDAGEILYIGKAGNLKRRVSSYFNRPHDYRIQKLVSEIVKIDYKRTDTAIEALILESELIKKYLPPYNVREKDDKSFLYVEITRDKFPRILLVREKEKEAGKRYGPFTSASSVREALRIIRRIFPFSIHEPLRVGKFTRPCFEYEIGICPGVCMNLIPQRDYLKNIRNIKLFFEGKKEQVIKSLEKEMDIASRKLEFEKAEKFRRQLFALRHIQDIALITEPEIPVLNDQSSAINFNYRIEGYDISNISGTSAVGSMVVFINGEPDKSEYRKFRIRSITEPNDTGMLKEMLERRFDRTSGEPDGRRWKLPNLILIDGGRGQVNTAKKIILKSGLNIPVIGIAKGPKRKRNDFIGIIPKNINKKTLIRVRDEAHRFAISYHKKVRGREFMN